MKGRGPSALDVADAPTVDGQRVGDQRPMTPRDKRLGTHDRCGSLARPGLETQQAVLKGLRLHMVCESPE
jgi:hypothetical protein